MGKEIEMKRSQAESVNSNMTSFICYLRTPYKKLKAEAFDLCKASKIAPQGHLYVRIRTENTADDFAKFIFIQSEFQKKIMDYAKKRRGKVDSDNWNYVSKENSPDGVESVYVGFSF